jgi:membrane-bound serine protease (ClpP class)
MRGRIAQFLSCVLLLAAPALAQSIEPTTRPATAAIIHLQGMIDDFNRDGLIRRFDEARKTGASVVILNINTYGGLVTSGLDISRFLKRQDDLHVIAFVDEKAISAGVMIAIACDEIVMSPSALMGDSAPISMGAGGGMEEMAPAERAKAESPILEDFYSSAQKNGYDPLLTEAMVSVGRAVHWIEKSDTQERRFVNADDYKTLTAEGWKPVEGVRNPIDAPDTLLTVHSDLAIKLGLAKGIAASADALAAERGYTVVANLFPGTAERWVGFLSGATLRSLLFTIFLMSLYLSLNAPGHGMPEAIAMTSLGLLVGVPMLTGYAQWWEVIAIVLGLVLLAIELFVIPGFGVAGISGIVLVLGGMLMTFVGDDPMPGIMPKLPGTWAALQTGLIVVVGGMAASLFLWIWLNRYLPKMPYANRLILTTTSGGSEEIRGQSTDLSGGSTWPTPGAIGTSVTDLRPGGSAAFLDDATHDTRIADVVSDTGFVRVGTKVQVREVTGGRIVVRATDGTG